MKAYNCLDTNHVAIQPQHENGEKTPQQKYDNLHFSLFFSFRFAAPNFVSSITKGDFVYFFFRETAVEYINCGKVSFHNEINTGYSKCVLCAVCYEWIWMQLCAVFVYAMQF